MYLHGINSFNESFFTNVDQYGDVPGYTGDAQVGQGVIGASQYDQWMTQNAPSYPITTTTQPYQGTPTTGQTATLAPREGGQPGVPGTNIFGMTTNQTYIAIAALAVIVYFLINRKG